MPSLAPDLASSADDPLAPLLEPALERDPKAVRALVEAVAPEVARVVRAIVGRDAAQLDDLVQEALLGFIRALPSFGRRCTLRRFAARVAARSAVSASRAAARKASHHGRWVEGERRLPARASSSPARHLLQERRRTVLARLLGELPEAQAEALVLRVVLEHSVSEIAEATGAPVNTVRSRVRLAKEALRKRIARDEHLSDALRETP